MSTPAADAQHQARKTVIGIRMTLIYSAIYAGFVVVSVFRPTWTGNAGLFGMNLAVTYGLALIVIAVILAVIYNHMVKTRTAPSAPAPGTASGKEHK